MFKMKKSVLMCAFALLLGSQVQAAFGDYFNKNNATTLLVGAGSTAFVKGTLEWYNQFGLKTAQAAAQTTATVAQAAAQAAANSDLANLTSAKSVVAAAALESVTNAYNASKQQLFSKSLQLPKQTIGFAVAGTALFYLARKLDSNKTFQKSIVESCLSTAEKIIGQKNGTAMQAAFAGLLTSLSLVIPS